MKVSYNWLQTYFDEKLPSPEAVGELLTFHAYELEGIEQVDDDSVIDVDILPNRSSDSLSHRGIARELSTLLNQPLKRDPFLGEVKKLPKSNVCEVVISDPELCPCYAITIIEGVEIAPSPEWLKKALETLGQRSINNVVDATNYIMLNTGQPLHAFDVNKLEGETKKITVCNAGEEISEIGLLGENDTVRALKPDSLVITDGNSKKPLAVAGIKGGRQAEVDEGTTRIILESAKFDASSVRKTARSINLSTDASQRFQNNPSQRFVGYALQDVTALILEIAGGSLEGGDEASEQELAQETVEVSLTRINGLLGTDITEEEVSAILERIGCVSEVDNGNFKVTPPFERTDINIAEDVIEEIGRVYGYEHIKAKQLPPLEQKSEINTTFYFADTIRNILNEAGYSEIYGYTFRSKGDIEAVTALASDKNFLRSNLSDGMKEYVEMNAHNAPLFGVDRIHIFEIGTVFPNEGERPSLALGVSGKKTDKILHEIKSVLEEKLGTAISENPHDGILEIDFSKLIEGLEAGDTYEPFEKNNTVYKEFSQYPFVTRDVALWVPESVSADDIASILREASGTLLTNMTLFDEFEKDGRVSYAFRLVFQSMDRTLTDIEVGAIMEKIYSKLEEKGFEIR